VETGPARARAQENGASCSGGSLVVERRVCAKRSEDRSTCRAAPVRARPRSLFSGSLNRPCSLGLGPPSGRSTGLAHLPGLRSAFHHARPCSGDGRSRSRKTPSRDGGPARITPARRTCLTRRSEFLGFPRGGQGRGTDGSRPPHRLCGFHGFNGPRKGALRRKAIERILNFRHG